MVEGRMTGADRGKEKLRMSLLGNILEPLREIVRVMEDGNNKYPDETSWQRRPRQDHVDAMMRHVLAFCAGQKKDPDSGLHPLAHAACRALFVMWFDLTMKLGEPYCSTSIPMLASESIPAGAMCGLCTKCGTVNASGKCFCQEEYEYTWYIPPSTYVGKCWFPTSVEEQISPPSPLKAQQKICNCRFCGQVSFSDVCAQCQALGRR